MNYRVVNIIFFIGLFQYLCGNSIVYDFRITQITKEHIFDVRGPKKKYTAIALIFDEISKKRYDDILLNYFGSLETFIYTYNSYFVRFDFAVANMQERTFKDYFSITQTDDILITLGKNYIITDEFNVSTSGLFGFPTHKIAALTEAGEGFGFGQFGIGAQFDSAYQFNQNNSFLFGGRYVYFCPRSAFNSQGERFKFSVGSLIDFIVASKNVWGSQGLEVGFTPRFSFGAKVSPHYDEIIQKTNYIRNVWFSAYQYRFVTNNTINRFLFDVSCGFDPAPKKYGDKYIVFMWVAWDIKF